MVSRINQINNFLKNNQIETKNLIPIKNDASFRKYFRVDKKILMDADPHLGEDVGSFININHVLREFKLNVPEIFTIDKENGFLLLEDLGENIFSQILNSENEEQLYKQAIDVLVEIYKKDLNKFSNFTFLEKYSVEKLQDESQLFIEWYLKKYLKINITDTDIKNFKDIINKIFNNLDTKFEKLVLRDYHVDNLILQKSKLGLKQVGILDFQDAVLGSSSYDLISIIEDVRRPISKDLKNILIKYFIDSTGYDPNQLEKELAFYSVQRNLKILGIFSRLNLRDNKSKYMGYNDNAWKYIESNLNNPTMSDLKVWLKKILPNAK
ncbi:MAG: aminoglycoside phosphotransferase family protein [Candidatus Pelagibacterales bacterium]|jgi:aminoglycoside/choline kinase family phosphotransferase|tara:strand:+ start:1562 stop:2533 length:972 start_codon:yes stop_codon:yes gene_type:complete